MRVQLKDNFEKIVSVENLLEAWKEFEKGKRGRKDVQEFSLRLMDNIFSLHNDLIHHTYKHGSYQAFKINDPKPRDIHKASVRDRLLHHAIYRILYSFFNKTFIADSFSCRKNKGTHKGLNRFRSFACKVGQNNIRTCWVLKCDIRKFFGNINHEILIRILEKYIPDENIMWLLREVINSFPKDDFKIGLPLGNLTSQLFVNIYMNEFDQCIKHKHKAKYYIRYADDFVILSENWDLLVGRIKPISSFLKNELKLELHPQKISVRTFASGNDFLGWVHFLDHRVLRTAAKRRMFRRIKASPKEKTLNSYLGFLSHGNTHKIQSQVLEKYLFLEE